MTQQTTSDNNDSLAQRIAKHMMNHEGVVDLLALEYDDGGAGWAQVSLIIKKNMLNGHGSVHGGIIFSLADSAFAYACNSHNKTSVAQQASISFLSPGLLGERLTARAHENGVVGRSGVYTVEITGKDKRVVAVFQGLARTIGNELVKD